MFILSGLRVTGGSVEQTPPHLVYVDGVVLLHAPPDDGPQALDRDFVILVLFRFFPEAVNIRLQQTTQPTPVQNKHLRVSMRVYVLSALETRY